MNDRERILVAVLLFLNALPILTGFVFVNLFAVDVPYRDQFSNEIPNIISYHDGTFVATDFLALNNDHRPIFVHILTFYLNRLTEVNNIVETNAGYLLHVLAFVILWILFRKVMPELHPLSLYLLPVSWFFFNFYLIAAYLWGILLSSSLCLVALMSMVYCLERSNHYDWFFGGSLLAAGVGMFSWVAGVFLWPAGFIQILLSKSQHKTEKIITWAGVTGGILFINYVFLGFPLKGVHGYEGYSRYVASFFNYPFHKAILFIESLGSNIVHSLVDSVFFGIILLSIFVILLVIDRKIIFRSENAGWFSIIVYSLLVHAALVVSRSGEGGYFGPANNLYFLPAVRHFPSTFIFVIGVYSLVLSSYGWHVSRHDARGSQEKNRGADPASSRTCISCALLGFAALLLFSGYILHFQNGVIYGVLWAEKNTENREILLNYQDMDETTLHKLRITDRSLVEKLDRYNLSIFKPSSPGLYPGWLPENIRRTILNSSYVRVVDWE